ncbi:unnamed protein product [Rhizoctonia solani]|uniref:DUF6535 domain-containing protein n=1 Tax=Rhizoctonia solani TaxID=456999 RepID=A0A8H3C5M6_9AGAM|nr:unnamed protein product [Rhizoctonia solani]
MEILTPASWQASSRHPRLTDKQTGPSDMVSPGPLPQSPGASFAYNHAEPGVNRQKADNPAGVGPTDTDMEGAELSKEARFWKVYVREADQYDTDLVDSWNKSLDVILVFAALFSAVSTAFIVESSKKLAQDPTEIASDTLVKISQTLLVIASNAQMENPPILQENNSTLPFVPSKTSVLVNTLWYTSLALSLATSLIAMLAKEWCRSFLAHRTGDAFQQAQRRQEKWIMIQRWKMQEFFMVLPSFIHLSLLLFAIGLCINVWELNTTVAIPIIAISGSAALFYIWSSIASCFIRFYPYTTWITNILVLFISNVITPLISRTIKLMSIIISPLISHVISPLITHIISPLIPNLISPLNSRIIAPLMSSIFRSKILKICGQVIMTWLWPLGVLAWILYKLLWPLWKLSEYIYSAMLSVSEGDQEQVDKIEFDDETGVRIHFSPSSGRQGEITSLSLQWLIENCENPDSVSVALQAISGASSKHPLEPLNECNAALKILQRMVSSYSEERLETQRYTRALKFLGHGGPSSQTRHENDHGGELEVMIWELRSLNETCVSNLITDGKFSANDYNINALRLGSMAASYSLRLLKEPSGLNRAILGQITSAIQNELHPAALVSLSHAVALMSACSERCPPKEGRIIAHSCLEHLNSIHEAILTPDTHSAQLESSLAAWVQLPSLLCVLALGRTQDEPLAHKSIRVAGVLRILGESASMEEDYIKSFLLVGLTEVKSKPDFYFVEDSFARTYQIVAMESDIPQETKLRAVKDVYQVAQTDHPALSTYLFILHFACRAEQSQLGQLGFLSRFRFLRISSGLTRQMSKTGLIQLLIKFGDNWRPGTYGYLAKIQLWLFYALLGDLPSKDYTREQLDLSVILEPRPKKRIIVRSLGDSESGETTPPVPRRPRLEAQILGTCIEFGSQAGPLAIYSYRVVECILQTSQYVNDRDYDDLRARIHDELIHVPQRLRGLDSFTPAHIWARVTASDLLRPSHVEVTMAPPLQAQPRSPAGASHAPRSAYRPIIRDAYSIDYR